MDTLSAAQAVEALIHEYYKLVFHTIYGLTGDWEESQDLTQDTFHQALKAIDAARAASGAQFRAKAWLLRIALNTVRMQRRRHNLFRFIPFSHVQRERREQASEAEEDVLNQQAAPVQPAGYGVSSASGRAANEDPAANIAERDVVQRAMARLPQALRTCLLLSVVGGFSSSEIAEILDISEAAVRQRLVRARKHFQQFYALESGEDISDSNNLQMGQTSIAESDSPQNHVTFLHSHASPLL
jgi:RNA polymerase sigma factor (sigma-70 family)